MNATDPFAVQRRSWWPPELGLLLCASAGLAWSVQTRPQSPPSVGGNLRDATHLGTQEAS
jgi:hypothetical protein